MTREPHNPAKVISALERERDALAARVSSLEAERDALRSEALGLAVDKAMAMAREKAQEARRAWDAQQASGRPGYGPAFERLQARIDALVPPVPGAAPPENEKEARS